MDTAALNITDGELFACLLGEQFREYMVRMENILSDDESRTPLYSAIHKTIGA